MGAGEEKIEYEHTESFLKEKEKPFMNVISKFRMVLASIARKQERRKRKMS